MKQLETTLDKILDNFFHLPTLTVIAVAGIMLIWFLFDLSLDVGSGFIRLSSNQGGLDLYWLDGCCDLDWQ